MEPKNYQSILCHLRALREIYVSAHWQFAGDYGDHLLFERLYTGLDKSIDRLGERMVSHFKPSAVDVDRISAGVSAILSRFSKEAEVAGSIPAMLELEDALHGVVARALVDKSIPSGLRNHLEDLLDKRDEAVYLLERRKNVVAKKNGALKLTWTKHQVGRKQWEYRTIAPNGRLWTVTMFNSILGRGTRLSVRSADRTYVEASWPSDSVTAGKLLAREKILAEMTTGDLIAFQEKQAKKNPNALTWKRGKPRKDYNRWFGEKNDVALFVIYEFLPAPRDKSHTRFVLYGAAGVYGAEGDDAYASLSAAKRKAEDLVRKKMTAADWIVLLESRSQKAKKNSSDLIEWKLIYKAKERYGGAHREQFFGRAKNGKCWLIAVSYGQFRLYETNERREITYPIATMRSLDEAKQRAEEFTIARMTAGELIAYQENAKPNGKIAAAVQVGKSIAPDAQGLVPKYKELYGESERLAKDIGVKLKKGHVKDAHRAYWEAQRTHGVKMTKEVLKDYFTVGGKAAMAVLNPNELQLWQYARQFGWNSVVGLTIQPSESLAIYSTEPQKIVGIHGLKNGNADEYTLLDIEHKNPPRSRINSLTTLNTSESLKYFMTAKILNSVGELIAHQEAIESRRK